MRAYIAIAILSLSTPVCAQTVGTTSGATAMINSSDPPSTQSRLTTTPTVVAPGLTAAGIETCLGSAAGGISLMGGGFTFGSTRVDEGCTIRLLARQLYAFGFQKAAVALMCQDEHVAAAMQTVGSPCLRAPGQATGQASGQVGMGNRVSVLPQRDQDQDITTGSVSAFSQPQDGATLPSRLSALPPREEEEVVPRRNGFM
jgi:hypothetical protein